jgi:hypothetical protein
VPLSKSKLLLAPYSPKLTLPEKAALKAIEDGDVEDGTRSFLMASFSLVQNALEPHFDEVDLNAVLELLVDEGAPELRAIRKIFWEDDNVTPWGELFLTWEEGDIEDSDLALGMDDLNDYLVRSADFYEALEVETETELPLGPQDDSVESVEDSPEFGGTSWDTIKVQTIYWPKPSAPLGPQDGVDENDEDSQEFGGTSWDSIKIETIYWDKSKLEAAPSEPDVSKSVESVPEPPEPVERLAEPQADDDESSAKDVETEIEDLESEPEDLEPEPYDSEDEDDGEELTLSHAPLDPFGNKNRLVVKNKYLGYGKNSQGVLGLCGQLKISYFRDKELVGRLESSNPLLFLSSSRLSGQKSTVTYWLPPVAFPHPAGHIGIQTPLGSKTLPLHTLFPKSRTDLMLNRSVILCLFLPALVGFLYFALVYVLTANTIDIEAQQTFPRLYRAAMSGIDTGDFRAQGLGLYRLRVVPAAESLQMIWAAVLFLAPLAASKFFYYLSHRRKRRFGGLLAAAQLMPTLLLLMTWSFQDLVFPLYSHRDFAPLDLQGFLLWSVVMNILVAAYLFLSVFGVWDRKIKQPEVRFLLPIVLTAIYLATMFVIIFGRSWFS